MAERRGQARDDRALTVTGQKSDSLLGRVPQDFVQTCVLVLYSLVSSQYHNSLRNSTPMDRIDEKLISY